jgi:glycine dehydrogenase subunit 1
LLLVEKLETLKGVKRTFSGPFFHEAAVSLPTSADNVLQALKTQKILAGLDLKEYYPEIGNTILVCATETKIPADLIKYTECFGRALAKHDTSVLNPT